MRAMAFGVALLVAALGVGAAEVRDGQRVRFDVSDAETGELLYSGVETVRVRDGIVEKDTVYRAPERGEVLTERVSYELDTLRVNELVSISPDSGGRTRVRRDGKRISIEHVPRAGVEARRDDGLTWGPSARVGKTLHHMVVRHWNELVDGKAVSFDLLVPSRFDFYRFRLVARPRADDGSHVFRLEPESWLLRQAVAPMDFHYDDQRRALRYVGPTTVGYDEHPDRRVIIRFSY